MEALLDQHDSAIIHLSSTPLRGHYRALLRVGSSWCITDDVKSAEALNIHDGHLRNIYIVIVQSQPVGVALRASGAAIAAPAKASLDLSLSVPAPPQMSDQEWHRPRRLR